MIDINSNLKQAKSKCGKPLIPAPRKERLRIVYKDKRDKKDSDLGIILFFGILFFGIPLVILVILLLIAGFIG